MGSFLDRDGRGRKSFQHPFRSPLWAGEAVLPKSQSAPASLTQQPGDGTIALFVPHDFLTPKPDAGLGHPAVPTAAVPKAAVNKHGQLCLRKSEVWISRQAHVTPPAPYPALPKDRRHLQLGALVSPRADCRHHRRPLPSVKNVSHQYRIPRLLPSAFAVPAVVLQATASARCRQPISNIFSPCGPRSRSSTAFSRSDNGPGIGSCSKTEIGFMHLRQHARAIAFRASVTKCWLAIRGADMRKGFAPATSPL